MRYVSIFSGIEAASVAWEPLGWEPMAFSEIDEFPSAVLQERYPNVPNLGDITRVDWKRFVDEHGRPDVLVGGSPCQSFSIAGGRASLDGESRLMYEYVRACDEIRSEWIVWENVPGVLSVRDNAFGQLLLALQDVGYIDIAWRVLDAQFFGVAQRRRRVFLVGHLGAGGHSAAVLFEPESVRGNTQASREKRAELARATRRGTTTGGTGGVAFVLKVRGGSDTYVKQDGSIGTAGKGALVGDDVSFTIAATQDQTAFVMASAASNAEVGVGVAPTLIAHAKKQAPILIGCVGGGLPYA